MLNFELFDTRKMLREKARELSAKQILLESWFADEKHIRLFGLFRGR
nr:hypothetical protein [uncultured Desulfobacter sp.]